MKTKFLKIASALLFLLWSVGCTKENNEDCIYGVYLQYYYTYNKHYVNLFGPEVQKLSIFVFDKDDMYFNTYVIDDPSDLETNNKIHLPLPAGRWTIVSWGGFMDTYNTGTLDDQPDKTTYSDRLVKGETSLEEFRLWLKFNEQSQEQIVMIDAPQPLFWGKDTKVDIAVDAVSGATVGMMKDVNDLILKIGGIGKLTGNNLRTTKAAEDAFNIHTTIQNGRYKYNNDIGEYARRVRYLQPKVIVGDTLFTTFTVMRLMENDQTGVMTIESPYLPGGVINIPIVETILRNPNYNNQEDLDREDTYEFIIDINLGLGVTITINGWKVINIIPEPK